MRGEPPWREIKLNLSTGKGARSDEIRLVAQDRSLGVDGWMALAPMRGPKLVPFTEAVGQQPGYLEWPVQFASPCLKPFDVRDGIAGTGVHAAFLKCAIEAKGLTHGVERTLRAVAATHRATAVHTKALAA